VKKLTLETLSMLILTMLSLHYVQRQRFCTLRVQQETAEYLRICKHSWYTMLVKDVQFLLLKKAKKMNKFIRTLVTFLLGIFFAKQEEVPQEKIVTAKMFVINSYSFRALIMDRGFVLVQNPFPGQDMLKGTECYARIHETKGNQFFFIGMGKHLYVKEGSKSGVIKYTALYPVINEKELERVINDFIPVRNWHLNWCKGCGLM